jgi:hypothetical protein
MISGLQSDSNTFTRGWWWRSGLQPDENHAPNPVRDSIAIGRLTDTSEPPIPTVSNARMLQARTIRT